LDKKEGKIRFWPKMLNAEHTSRLHCLVKVTILEGDPRCIPSLAAEVSFGRAHPARQTTAAGSGGRALAFKRMDR